ncbi:MAG: ribonuclease P protein subunit [Thaumarchaeota archaeon]|nr:ribonuclease P protein subunit [Nitrososphaerota archaeon]
MIRILGSEVTIIKCASAPQIVGLQGIISLETAHMLTITSAGPRTLTVPKKGTALQLKGSNELVIADEMKGRLEERLARGMKV